MPKSKIQKQSQNKISKKEPISKEVKVPKPEIFVIDAKGQILGRCATKIANILRGKDKPSFRPYILQQNKVLVINAEKIKVSGKKMEQKNYFHHTGYIGHLKKETMKEVYANDPTELLRRAVTGMLPKNKLQQKWLKNLEIKIGE